MDLISALADQLVALNNAKPWAPSKAEVEQVLARWLLITSHNTARYKFPGATAAEIEVHKRAWERADA